MVAHPGPIALASLPQTTVNASFTAMGGNQSHHWTGPELLDVLAAAGITDAPGKKTHFRHVILATGKDGYEVAISIGEIDPMTEGKTVIMALQQDGAPLPAPRLIVPGDTHFARGVRDLTGLEVR
jgi:DMSO/TMAO reductase YedYZ molybdopterin-dependent catalytic subunit